MSEDSYQISPPIKPLNTRFQVFDGNGKFKCVTPLSSNFVSQFLIYRETFHDSRPPGSKNDFGWYKNLKKQWSEWTKDGRAETNEIPTKSILDKIFASKKARQIENILSTPTDATAPSKCYIYPFPLVITMTLIMYLQDSNSPPV